MAHRILLAYDGSRDGRVALREGAILARIQGACVHLLAAVSLPHTLSMAEAPLPQEDVDTSFREARALLEAGILRLQEGGVAAQGHLAVGNPAQEITRYARQLDCDLIVLGHRHGAHAPRWWEGAVGAQLLDQAPCSILVAKGAGLPKAPGEGAASEGDLLDFWFGAPEHPEAGQVRPMWFQKDPAVDGVIRDRFAPLLAQAADGCLEHWRDHPEGALALVLLFDQIPRHLYRGRGQAFAFDADARIIAREALAQSFAADLLPVQRAFLYLPFEHSEDLADQERAVALFAALAAESPGLASFYDYALRHHAIIRRFGRFPHRNDLLGRAGTPEEQEFLQQPGSRF